MSPNQPNHVCCESLQAQSTLYDTVISDWPLLVVSLLTICLMVYSIKKRGMVVRKRDFIPITVIVVLATMAKHFDLLVDWGARFAKAIWP